MQSFLATSECVSTVAGLSATDLVLFVPWLYHTCVNSCFIAFLVSLMDQGCVHKPPLLVQISASVQVQLGEFLPDIKGDINYFSQDTIMLRVCVIPPDVGIVLLISLVITFSICGITFQSELFYPVYYFIIPTWVLHSVKVLT